MHAFQIIGREDVTRGKAGSDEVSTTYRISATAADTGGCDEAVIYASSVSHCSVESNAVVWLFGTEVRKCVACIFFLRTLLERTNHRKETAISLAVRPGPTQEQARAILRGSKSKASHLSPPPSCKY